MRFLNKCNHRFDLCICYQRCLEHHLTSKFNQLYYLLSKRAIAKLVKSLVKRDAFCSRIPRAVAIHFLPNLEFSFVSSKGANCIIWVGSEYAGEKLFDVQQQSNEVDHRQILGKTRDVYCPLGQKIMSAVKN